MTDFAVSMWLIGYLWIYIGCNWFR